MALRAARGAGAKLVADRLVRRHGFRVLRFGQPLADMLAAGLGLAPDDLRGPGKRRALPQAGGKTAARLMASLGQDWGRRLVHPDLWALRWEALLGETLLAGAGPRVLADDVRFPNEAAAARRRGGELWLLERPGFLADGPTLAPDRVLRNDGTVAELLRRVDAAVAAMDAAAGRFSGEPPGGEPPGGEPPEIA